jgi:hypothetical protein
LFYVCACTGCFATRYFNTVSESLKAIRSARAEYELRTALSEQERRRFANSAACARDYDDLVFDS